MNTERTTEKPVRRTLKTAGAKKKSASKRSSSVWNAGRIKTVIEAVMNSEIGAVNKRYIVQMLRRQTTANA